MIEKIELPRTAIHRGGIVGGVIAGSIMFAFAIVYAGFSHTGFWTPIRLIAASMDGDPALIEQGGASGAGGRVEVLITAIIIQFVFSAGWGIVFVGLFKRLSGIAVLGAGLLFGLAVCAVMRWGVLVWADTTWYERLRLASGPFVIAHLVYGIVVALAAYLARAGGGELCGGNGAVIPRLSKPGAPKRVRETTTSA